MTIRNIASKVSKHGFLGSAQIAVRQVVKRLRVPTDFLIQHSRLKRHSFEAKFLYEGGLVVKLHRSSVMDVLAHTGRQRVRKSALFLERPKKEVLLRRIIHSLYETGVLSRDKSIVDIGAWLSDNAIVWASFLRDPALVYAIDPSPENIEFGKSVAKLNGVSNVRWVEAVCSDKSGIPLHFQGKLDHARFNSVGAGKSNGMTSKTLDEVVGSAIENVGLLHVDVEGLEFSVLKGARQVIARSKPIVLFEQHISKENVREICDLLRASGYQVFMINEVLPGCSLDCRNFLAAPSGILVEDVLAIDQQNGRAEDTWYATLGGALVRLS